MQIDTISIIGLGALGTMYADFLTRAMPPASIRVIADEARCRSPLIGLENCVVTPHAAYLSEDSYAELRQRAFLNCLSAVQGETPIDRVNGPLEWV